MARSKRNHDQEEMFEAIPAKAQRTVGPLEAKSENQQKYINAIKNFRLTFGVGPAGSGKTYLATCLAAEAYLSGHTQQIVITRPAVEAGEKLGFLPGELEEKYDPYLIPFRQVLEEKLGASHVKNLVGNGVIEAAPLAYMRGRSFKNAWVILDEAQNTTPMQMKMFLTRIGHNTTVIVNGDETQCDLPGVCGLSDAIKRVSFIPSVKVIRFTKEDVVRSGLVQEIVEAYERSLEAENLAPPARRTSRV